MYIDPLHRVCSPQILSQLIWILMREESGREVWFSMKRSNNWEVYIVQLLMAYLGGGEGGGASDLPSTGNYWSGDSHCVSFSK